MKFYSVFLGISNTKDHLTFALLCV